MKDDRDTYKIATWYEAFEPEGARWIAEHSEIPHASKHGSRLNMAEFGRSMLARKCLDRRIETRGELRLEVSQWERLRVERGVVIRWQLTTADARIKLRRLYPTIRSWRTTRRPIRSGGPLRSCPPYGRDAGPNR